MSASVAGAEAVPNHVAVSEIFDNMAKDLDTPEVPTISPINTFPILVCSRTETDERGRPKVLEQGTPEWHLWRSGGFWTPDDPGGVGGSDVATIMGVNSWDDPVSLWRRRKGLIPPKTVSEAMLRGSRLEPVARTEFTLDTGLHVEPKCFQHPQYPWVRVSLDGITEDHCTVVEIKCPGNYTHSIALKGQIPTHYKPQVQWQMFATGTDRCFYYSYMPELGGKWLFVERDENYIRRMFDRVQLFWDYLQGDVEPPLEMFACGDAGGDFARVDPAWKRAADDWLRANAVLKDAVLEMKHAEQRLEELMQRKKQGVAAGAGILVHRIVDPESHEVALNVVEEGE